MKLLTIFSFNFAFINNLNIIKFKRNIYLKNTICREQSEAAEEVFSMGILRDYIAYAKQKFKVNI